MTNEEALLTVALAPHDQHVALLRTLAAKHGITLVYDYKRRKVVGDKQLGREWPQSLAQRRASKVAADPAAGGDKRGDGGI